MQNYDFRLQHLPPKERYSMAKKINIEQKCRLYAEYRKARVRMGPTVMATDILLTEIRKLDSWLANERKCYRAATEGVTTIKAMEDIYLSNENYEQLTARWLYPSVVSRRVADVVKSKPLEKLKVDTPPPSINTKKGDYYYGI